MNATLNSMAEKRYAKTATPRTPWQAQALAALATNSGQRTAAPSTLPGPCFASATGREMSPAEARALRDAWPVAAITLLVAETANTIRRDKHARGRR